MTNCLSRFSQGGKHIGIHIAFFISAKYHKQSSTLFFSSKKKKSQITQSSAYKKRGGKFDACLIVATLRIMLSLQPTRPSTSFTPSCASPLVVRASSLGSTIPPSGTLFHSRPDVKWVAAGSTGAQEASTVGCGVAPWESSAAFSTGVAWVDEERGGTGTGGMDDSLSPPHPPPCAIRAPTSSAFETLRPTLASRISARRHRSPVTPGTRTHVRPWTPYCVTSGALSFPFHSSAQNSTGSRRSPDRSIQISPIRDPDLQTSTSGQLILVALIRVKHVSRAIFAMCVARWEGG